MIQPVPDRSIGAYLEALGSSEPTPGGGSVAGVIGALGCGLGRMVISLTTPDAGEAITSLATVDRQLSALQKHFTDLAERDEAAYQGYRDTASMPKTSSEEKTRRRSRMQEALKTAALVPLETAESAYELADCLTPVRQFGNPYLLSDASIAMLCASCCFETARLNVNVNLAMIRDEDWVTDIASRLERLASNMRDKVDPWRQTRGLC